MPHVQPCAGAGPSWVPHRTAPSASRGTTAPRRAVTTAPSRAGATAESRSPRRSDPVLERPLACRRASATLVQRAGSRVRSGSRRGGSRTGSGASTLRGTAGTGMRTGSTVIVRDGPSSEPTSRSSDDGCDGDGRRSFIDRPTPNGTGACARARHPSARTVRIQGRRAVVDPALQRPPGGTLVDERPEHPPCDRDVAAIKRGAERAIQPLLDLADQAAGAHARGRERQERRTPVGRPGGRLDETLAYRACSSVFSGSRLHTRAADRSPGR